MGRPCMLVAPGMDGPLVHEEMHCRSMIGRDHFGSKCIKKLRARYEFFGKRQLARILGSHGPWTNHHGDHMQPQP